MTSGEWMDQDDPETQAWVKHVLTDLVPKVQDSSVTISIVPTGEVDVKFAVELGVSIMLDKPVILLVTPGARVPEHLARVADEIVEIADLASPNAAKQMTGAITRVMKKLEKEDEHGH